MTSEYEMAKAALRRPHDYGQRHPQSQWNIDARLGILDWDGIDINKARSTVEQGDDGTAESKFKMSFAQLREIVEGFDARFAAIKEAKA
jgi:hypothetical protein